MNTVSREGIELVLLYLSLHSFCQAAIQRQHLHGHIPMQVPPSIYLPPAQEYCNKQCARLYCHSILNKLGVHRHLSTHEGEKRLTVPKAPPPRTVRLPAASVLKPMSAARSCGRQSVLCFATCSIVVTLSGY
jgi:hypothetical protein